MSGTPADGWATLRCRVDGGAVGVAVTSVPEVGEPPAEMIARLTPEEQARAARFRFAADRWIYVAAHFLLARAVEMTLGAGGRYWSLDAGSNGAKPSLRVDGHEPLYVNLSHTRGAAAVAITRAGEVGVDVEAVRPLIDREGIAALVFTANERRALAEATDPADLFVRLWTRKEAVVKAFGIGLGAPLQNIDVLDPDALSLPDSMPGACALTDVLWSARPQIALALCSSRIEHELLDIPFDLLAAQARNSSMGSGRHE
jgi:4'-phosphopantetheinyl transferase